MKNTQWKSFWRFCSPSWRQDPTTSLKMLPKTSSWSQRLRNILQHLNRFLWRFLFHRRLSQYEMHDLSESERTECLMLLSGCFMLLDSEAFKAVDGFDEKYFLYFEDFDLSLRISNVQMCIQSIWNCTNIYRKYVLIAYEDLKWMKSAKQIIRLY